jgi:two-component system NtrC family sensor kinase
MKDHLATLGALTAGIAHEINNPLSLVMNNLVLMKLDLTAFKMNPEAHMKHFEELINGSLRGVEQMSDIVKHLKGFAQMDVADLEPVDIHYMLNFVTELALPVMTNRVILVKQYANNIPMIVSSHSKLHQVFLNLIMNASQAIKKKNTKNNKIKLKTTLESGYVRIDVIDNGEGISVLHRSRIFDPFFTTKAKECGLGLGLSICNDIVLQLKGKITFKSKEGAGSTFSVYLPR